MATGHKHDSIFKRGAAMAVSLMMIVSIAAAWPVPAHAAGGTLTRGGAAEMLLNYAGHYREGLKPADFVSGYPDGSTREGQAITRLEALVMASRAFGSLPKPVGADKALAPKPAGYSDVPGWAQAHIDNLNNGGILVGTESGLLKGSEPMPGPELALILKRLFALYGTNLKDDFYAAANRDLIKSEAKGADAPKGAFDIAGGSTDEKLKTLFNEVLNGQWEAGSPEKKIVDLYESINNMGARDKAGVGPIKPYLDAIDAVRDLKDLEALQVRLRKELIFSPIFVVGLGQGYADSNKNIIEIGSAVGSLDERHAKGAELLRLMKYAEAVLELAGDADPPASAAKAAELEGSLSRARIGFEEEQDAMPVAGQEKGYPIEQVQALCPNVGMKAIIAATGLKEEPLYYLEWSEAAMLKEIAKVYTEENIEAIKAGVKVSLLTHYGGFLSQGFLDAADMLNASAEAGTEEGRKKALMHEALGFVGGYFSDKYGERYFPKEAKEEITGMIKVFVADYKERVQNLGWMGAGTKSMALKKLDSMVVKVGCPDKKDGLLNSVNYASVANGGSYFSNALAFDRHCAGQELQKQGKPVDKDEWGMPSYTVNAYYSPLSNEIVFPAAILQAPFYSLGQKPEENYAGIGWVIAHEITHGFDTIGAQFDEKGNAANWWAEADYAEFQKRCGSVAAFYEGVEAAPGITKKNGKTTLGEDIADMGGLSAALNAAAKLESPDYGLFFRHAARVWFEAADRETLESLAAEAHSYNKNRINVLFSTMDKFYEAFGIKEGDGMYVPPERRVKVW